MRPALSWYPSQRHYKQRKWKNSMSWEYLWKILNNLQANQIQQHIKRIAHDDQIGFILIIQTQFNREERLIGVIYHINKKLEKKKKTLCHLNWWRKASPSHNKNHFHAKKNNHSTNNRNNLHIIKSIYEKPSKHYAQWWKTEHFTTKTMNKTRRLSFTISI
jgi:hypothetical protein